MFLLEETSKSSDSQLNLASKSRLSRSSKSSKQKQGKYLYFIGNQCQIYLEKLKPIGNEQLPIRKSQDISNIIETEKIAAKKSIYLKSAEFLLKYNIAAV